MESADESSIDRTVVERSRESALADLFRENSSRANTNLEKWTGTGDHSIRSIEAMSNLFEELESNDFWDGILESVPICGKPQISDETSRAEFIATGLDAIAESAEAYEQLYSSQEKLIEFIDKQSDLPLLSSSEESSTADVNKCFQNVTGFSQQDSYWDEVVEMQTESLTDKNIEDKREQSQEMSTSSTNQPLPINVVADEIPDEKMLSIDAAQSSDIVVEESSKVDVEEETIEEKIFESSSNRMSEAPQNSSSIVTSTLWEDLDVVRLKPAQQEVLEKTTISNNPILSQLAEEIDLRSLNGPNTKYSFLILGIAALSVALISYSNSVRESPWLFRILWVLSYTINFITVSIPGRLDRVLISGQHIKPWTSLFEAATWAFAIWGVIYASEVVLSGYVSIIGIPMRLFQRLVPYWLAGNWCQGLWCFAFRPEFKNALWIPTLFLALGTYCFTYMHYETSVFLRSYEGPARWGLILLRTPFAMHASWLAAATLLNFNSFAAVSKQSKGAQIAIAHASAFLAAAFGVYFALLTSDATLSLTVAWALEAVAQRSNEKITQPGNMVGAEVQESLAVSSRTMSGVAKCISLGIMVAPFIGQ